MTVNKNLSSIDISFSKVIPWSFAHVNLIGDWAVNFLLPATDHREFELGISTFLSVVINPLSIKYPCLEFLGANKFTFSSPSKTTLYSLKVRSSIAAPVSYTHLTLPTIYSV